MLSTLRTGFSGLGGVLRNVRKGSTLSSALIPRPMAYSPVFMRQDCASATIQGILDPARPPTKLPLIQPFLQKEYITPGSTSNKILEDPLISTWTPQIEDAPSPTSSIEKQAARLIVIRRTKMNKHKLRKLRKKMRFKWIKVKERRYIRKEKAFLDEKMALIKAAWKFDAKEYVAGVIKKAKEEPIPRKWMDPLMPEWYKEQEMAKEARLTRYQKVVNMYLNKAIKIKMK